MKSYEEWVRSDSGVFAGYSDYVAHMKAEKERKKRDIEADVERLKEDVRQLKHELYWIKKDLR